MFGSRFFPLTLLAFAAVLPGAAQDFHRLTFHFGGGFTQPVQEAEGRVDRGFNILAGGGVNVTRHFALTGEFMYNELSLSERTLRNVGVPGGDGRLLSVTLAPQIRFNPGGRVDGYLTGGGGWYRRTIEFTEPTLQVVNAFDPFYGVFYPATIPSNIVLGRQVQNKLGWNAGVGLEVRISNSDTARIFAEARYHYVYTRPIETTLVPVTFGFRW